MREVAPMSDTPSEGVLRIQAEDRRWWKRLWSWVRRRPAPMRDATVRYSKVEGNTFTLTESDSKRS